MADALGSGPSVRKDIGVQVPSRASFFIVRCKKSKDPYLIFFLSTYFSVLVLQFELMSFYAHYEPYADHCGPK